MITPTTLENCLSTLVGTKPLEEIIHTAALTPFVADSIPVSIMIVSESGAGKSKTVLRFEGPHIHRCDDLTSKGLFDIMKEDREQKIRYLMIPDFNPVLSHRASVSTLLIANLLTLSSEGMVNVSDGREQKELRHCPCGIITAVTTPMFMRSQRKWAELGITRRFLPIHYGYSLRTIMEAQEGIRFGTITSNLLSVIPVTNGNGTHLHTVAVDKEFALKIEGLSFILATNLAQYTSFEYHSGERKRVVKQGQQLYPMSPHITLQTLAKANAIKNHRESVTQDDLDFLIDLIRFTNMLQRPEL